MSRIELFSADMKMGDLINANYKLLLLLPRFNMELGFGEQTVAGMCEKHAVSVSFFLMVCSFYSIEDHTPYSEEIKALDITQLIAYLSRSHDYYLNNRLNAISLQLDLLVENSEESHAAVLSRFFEEYRKEVSSHFNYEEQVVFPYIQRIISGKTDARFTIDMFEENHTNINDKLSDLKNILIKYWPGHFDADDRNRLLFNIFEFEMDIKKHTMLEELILIPKVRSMEEEING